MGIVLPILAALRWDTMNPGQVKPEYPNGNRRVDFALCASDHRPHVFVEVKGVGRALEGDRQLFEYAFHEGIPLCLLTDGRDWSFYLPGAQGSYNDRRVYRLQLDERTPGECVKIFTRYLAYDRVRSGEAYDAAMNDYRDAVSRREADRSLPLAWAQLVNEPEELLVELLMEQSATICGYQPTTDDTVRFLRALQQPMAVSDPRVQARSNTRVEKTVRAANGLGNGKGAIAKSAIAYRVFGQDRQAKSASDAFIDIMREVSQRHPHQMAQIANAVRGRSRNHIGRVRPKSIRRDPILRVPSRLRRVGWWA